MDAQSLAQRWLTHLAVERGVSPHTLSNYTRDVRRYTDWLAAAGKTALTDVTATDIEAYVADLRRGVDGARPLAASSASTSSALSAYFIFCVIISKP